MSRHSHEDDALDYWLIGIFVAISLAVLAAFAYAVFTAPLIMGGILVSAFGVLFIPWALGRVAVWLWGNRNA